MYQIVRDGADPPILSSDCRTWCPLNQTFQLSPGSDECTVIQGPALLRGPVRRTPHVTSRELSIASNVRAGCSRRAERCHKQQSDANNI